MDKIEKENLENLVIRWGAEKGILDNSTFNDQMTKCGVEVGEMLDAYQHRNTGELIVEIGDVFVTLILARELIRLDDHHHRLPVANHSLNVFQAVSVIYENVGIALGIDDAERHCKRYFLNKALDGLAAFASLNTFDVYACLRMAYDKISKRTGKMVGGVWVKDVAGVNSQLNFILPLHEKIIGYDFVGMNKISIYQSVAILEKHNHWRRCNDDDCGCKQTDAKDLGIAIDVIIEFCKKNLVLKEMACDATNQ